MRRALPLSAAVLVVFAGALAWTHWGPTVRVEQPVSFDHRRHVVEEGVECLECHPGAERSPYAGFPDIRICHECHARSKSDDPDAVRVREYGARREQLPFVQVNRNAGHVYFTHGIHVSLAGIGCTTCHGDVAQWTEPPPFPDPALHSMAACMDCHRASGASLECVECHK